ncbi:DNA gyrase subunit A, partial [Bacillus cereus]|nr:DNA gyrase subunit A [Bacillus cereus]
LVNGVGGIAVGMATNIPPHNLGEVIDGVQALIENPDITPMELMDYIQGPDFPTAGYILGRSGIRQAYHTGRGSVTMRAKTTIEEIGNKARIIVHELPYQVNKARLVEKIAELVRDKRIEGITDLRDESDRTGMRVVIELRR